jgi:serine/threonine protein kinase
MDRVIRLLADGTISVPEADFPSSAQYLIFELADGDIRKTMDAAQQFDLAWALRTFHHITTGLMQLHKAGTAHQDLKPSNVLTFETVGQRSSIRIKSNSIAFCSGPRERPCTLSPLIPNTWVPRSAFSPSSILGARTYSIIPTCIVLPPVGVSRRMEPSGFAVELDSSYRCECSPTCFVVCSYNVCSRPLMRANYSSSPRWNRSAIGTYS